MGTPLKVGKLNAVEYNRVEGLKRKSVESYIVELLF
jgi:hypothetical protein